MIHPILSSVRTVASALQERVRQSVAFALGVSLISGTMSARADSLTWSGTTNGTWSDITNWGGTGVVPGTGDTATFDSAGNSNTIIDLGGGITLNTLVFDTGSAAAYTIGSAGGQTLTLDTSGGVSVGVAVSNGQTIDANVITDAATFRNDSTSANLTFNGVVSGSGGLTKEGDGTVIFTTAPTYGGATTVNSGTLKFEGPAIVTTQLQNYSIGTGATVEYDTMGANQNDPTGINITGAGTFKKTGGGQLSLISGQATWSFDPGGLLHVAEGIFNFGGGSPGNFSANQGDLLIDAGATFEGRSSGLVFDALNGGGTLGIGGRPTVSGGIGNVALTLGGQDGGGNFSGVIKNTTDYGQPEFSTAPFTLVKEGIGTQILSGNNTYSGTTTISGGVLQIGNGGANGTLGTGDTVNNASLVFDHTGTHSYDGAISGSGIVTKNGAGGQALNGNNTYTGATQVNAGTLILGGTNDSTVTVASGANLGGEGSTTGDIVFQGTHNLIIDADPTNALATSSNLDVNTATITVDVTGTGADTFDVIRFGTINGGIGNFTLGTHTLSGRVGAGVLAATSNAITLDLGFRTNTWRGNDGISPNFWDINTTANWQNSTDSAFFDGDAPVFDDTASSFTPILQSDITAGTVTFNNTTNAYTVSDLGAGAETLTINNGVSFNGASDVTLDTTVVSNSTATFANSGVVNVLKPFANNGGINITGSGDINLSGELSGTADLVKGGAGTTLITGDNNGYTGIMTVNEGTLVLQNTAINAERDYGPIAAGATLEFRMTAGGAAVGVLDIRGGGTFLKTGTQNMTQTSANAVIAMDSGGLFHLAEGSYTFGAGGIGFWNQNQGDLLMGPGTTFTGSATPIQFDAINGEGTMSFGGGLTIGGDNGDGTFTGAIIDATTNLNPTAALNNSIVKNGTGTQILSGNNTYSGTTTINGGLLVLNGTLGGDIIVEDGANIGGEASTTGNLTFLSSVHTLEVDSESLIALGSIGAGSLDVSAVNSGGLTVNVTGTGPSPVTVLTYGSGGLSVGGLDRFNLGTHQLSGRLGSAGPFVDTGSAITIDLGFAFRTWNNNSGDNLWNQGAGSSANWVEGDNTFFDLDSAIFDDTLSGPQVITLDQTVNATRVRFDNSTGNDYTINGNLGRTLSTSFAITFQGSGNTTINADIVGGSEIRQQGTGISTLGGSNSFTGDVSVSSGTLRAGSNMGLSSVGVSVDGTGSTLEVADGVTIANTITIGNTGDAKRLGLASGATSGTMSGNILSNNTTNGNFEVTADTGGTLTLSGVISGTGGIEKVGLGTVELTAANTVGGQTTVTQGTLRLVDDAIGSSALTYNIATGAVLEINRTSGNPFLPAIDWNGGGTFLKTGAGQFTQTSAGGDVALDPGALIHIAQGNYQFGGGGIGNWANNKADFRIDAGSTFITGATRTFVDALDGAGTVQVGGNGGIGFTVGVDNGSGTFDGVLQDGGFGAGNSFVKQGTGSQVLNGNNVNTGSFEVQAGRLDINGTNVADVNVAIGANLGGEGSTTGTVTFLGTTHTLDIDAASPAALGSTGTGGTNIGAVSVGGLTVNIAGTGPGAINVLTYGSGGFTGAVNQFNLGVHTPSARGAGSFMDNGVDAITIDLGYVTNTWVGDEIDSTFWDVATTENWSNSADAGLFQPGDDAVFDDTAFDFDPTLQADITAGNVVFNNTGLNIYTLNSASGQTLTTNGTFELAGTDVTVNANVSTTGGFISSGDGSMAVSGVISGSGDFVKSGTGQTTLSGTNTYTGQTIMSTGTLLFGADNVIPDGSALVHSGGDLNMNGRTDTLHSVTQTGGNFQLRGADVTLLNDSSFVNLTANSGQSVVRLVDGITLTSTNGISQLGDNIRIAFDTQGSSVADISASINTGDGNGSIDKLGTGTLRLTANNSAYGGGNRIENGTVEFTSIANINTPSSLGDADFQDVLRIGSASTSATLRMIGTNSSNTSDRAVQLGAAGGTIDVEESAQTLTINGVVSDFVTAGSLTKEGLGSLVLGGDNTYLGATHINQGVLQVDGDSSVATGAVNVGANGTLAGTGTVGGSTSMIIGGVVRPGSNGGMDRGTLTFNSDLDVTPGSLGLTGVDSSSRGTSYDAIDVVGTLTLDSSSTILFEADTGFTVSQGQSFDLLDWGSLVSTGFDVGTNGRAGGTGGGNLNLPDLSIFSLGWDVSSFLTNGTISVVPEPSRAGLMLLGVMGWVLRRRRA